MFGYRNSILPADLLPPPDKWPSRETATALIAALENGEARDYRDLEEITGVQDAAQVIGWCFSIYGYPALSPRVVAAWCYSGSMSPPLKASNVTQPPSMPEGPPLDRPRLTYGFNNR